MSGALAVISGNQPHFSREQVDRQVWYRASQLSNGCREFQGYVNRGGYGVVKIDGKSHLAHRVVWQAFNGPVEAGLEVCHKCDNRRCVALNHLFIGTRGENQRDMYDKGRGRKASGETHGRAKLTLQQVRAIRASHAAGIGYGRLAAEHGVHKSTVAAIVTGARWKVAR